MGKRIALDVVYRPKARGEVTPYVAGKTPLEVLEGAPVETAVQVAERILAHKRAQKAAQMRRYRAKKKTKP